MVAVFRRTGGLIPLDVLIKKVEVMLEDNNTLKVYLSGFWLDEDYSRPYRRSLPREYSYRKEDSLLRYARNLFQVDPSEILPKFTLDSPVESLLNLLPEPKGKNHYALKIFKKDFNYLRSSVDGAIYSGVAGAPVFTEEDLEDLDLMRDEVMAFISYLAEEGDIRGVKSLLAKG